MGRVVSIFVLILALIAQAGAQATMSGNLENYDGSTGILVLKLGDKKLKRFKLVKNAKVEWMGRNVSPNALRQGAKVAVRLCGAINEDPVPVNLVTDWGNSSQYVAKAARAPYYTRKGEYATSAGVGGTPEGAPVVDDPAKTVGMLGNGGIAPTGPPAGVMNPAPTGVAPMAPGPHNLGMSNQGSKMALPQNLMYSSSPSPFGMDSGNSAAGMMGMSSPYEGMMGAGQNYGGGQMQLQGRVLQADAASRTLVIQALNSPSPQQVIVAPGASVDPNAFQPGGMVNVSGIPVAGAIQAFSVTAAGR